MLRKDINSAPRKKKKGQSTVEYIILVAGVIGILIVFLSPNGPFRAAFNRTLSEGTNGMENMAGRLSSSRPVSP